MSSFSLIFPDEIVFALMADDIDVDGTIVKGEFREIYDAKELKDRIDMIFPTVEIMQSDESLFTSNSIVTFNGQTYGVLRTMPENTLTVLVILRESLL